MVPDRLCRWVRLGLLRFEVLNAMDPFEVRMQFLSLIRKLNASVLLSSRSALT